MAAVVAGAALSELLPQAVLIGGGENEMGFFYDFLLDSPPVPELATLLKEKMKGIYAQKPAFRETEMMVASAIELFKKKDHLGALGHLEDFDPKALVSIVHLGTFIDLAEGPFDSGKKAYLDRLEVRLIDGEIYRLEGCVEDDPDRLKEQVKRISRYQKQNYRTEGEKLGWWFWGLAGMVWLSKGLLEKRKLMTKIKEIFCQEVPEVVATSDEVLFEWASLKKKSTYWSFQEGEAGWNSEEGLYAEEMQSALILRSGDEVFVLDCLLQKIHQFHIIFGFHPTSYLLGWKRGVGKLEKALREQNWNVQKGEGKGELTLLGYAEDGLGRWQKIWELQYLREAHSYTLKLGVERILALLVEMNLGK